MKKWGVMLCLLLLLGISVQAQAQEEHKHRVRLTESIVDGVYEMLDEERHLYGGEVHKIVFCMDCGLVYRTEPLDRREERTEEHSFRDGRCQCGYINPCSHDGGAVTQREEVTLGHEKTDGQNHVRIYRIVGTEFCPDCGEVFEQWIEEDGIAGEPEPHRFGDGVCAACGFVNDCMHETTFGVDMLENTAYEPIGSSKHQMTGELITHILCERCLEELEQIFVESVSAEEEHVYGAGVCVWCGDENACDHPELRTEYHIFEPEYEQVDELIHIVRGEQTEVIACRECGEGIRDSISDPDAVIEEEHAFEDGVCVCGYENACLHEQTESRQYLDYTALSAKEEENDREFDRDDRCEALNERVHVLRGDLREETVCLSCGEQVSDVLLEEDAEQTDQHLMIDGKCAVCGYEGMCAHEEVMELFRIVDARYEAQEDGTHLVRGDRWRLSFCQVCGEELDREMTEADAEESERHSYADGECMFCGAANECGHARLNLFFYLNDAQYEAVDVWTHSARGELVGQMMCGLCMETLPAEMEEQAVERTENHVFVNGACMFCGAANECGHELILEMLFSGDGVYVPVDEHTHRIEGTVYSWRSCRECFVLIGNDPAADQKMNTQRHTFMEGVCADCGQENSCMHDVRETVIGFRNGRYARLDAERHMVYGAKYEMTVCSACGEETDERLVEYYASEEEKHDFEEGVCKGCGQRQAGL